MCLVLLCTVARSCSRLKLCPIKIENAINFVEAVASKQDSGWLLEITPICLEYTGFLTVYFEQFFFFRLTNVVMEFQRLFQDANRIIRDKQVHLVFFSGP